MNIRTTLIVTVAVAGVTWMFLYPNEYKRHRQSLGRRTLGDVRQLDAAVDQWVLATGQSNGAPIDTKAAGEYLKTRWQITDLLGNVFILGRVNSNQVRISPKTKAALAGVGIDWGAY